MRLFGLRSFSLAFACACACASLAPFGILPAQPSTGAVPMARVSLDAAIGGGTVRHDAFAAANTIQAEAMLAARFLRHTAASLVLAANGFTNVGGFGDDLDCRVDIAAPTGCYGRAFLEPAGALLGGAELRRYGAALRLLAGPIRFREEGSSARTGTHVRVDLAVPASSQIAFVFATRMSYLGRIRGEAIEIWGLSGGIRVQR